MKLTVSADLPASAADSLKGTRVRDPRGGDLGYISGVRIEGDRVTGYEVQVNPGQEDGIHALLDGSHTIGIP